MASRLSLVVMIAFFAAPGARAESFKSWAARGAREEREKDPKAAASSYSNALTLWSEEDGAAGKAKVLCARSNLREQDGDDEGALSDLSDCLAIDKKNAKGFHRRGVLLLKAGKSAPAISDFYKAVALDIRFGQAYADRAAAYESQGDKAFAKEDYRHACELGVKAACAKSRELAGKPPIPEKPKAKAKKPKAAKAPLKSPEEPAAAAGGAEPAAETPAVVEVGKPKAAAAAPSASSYHPKFKDCLKPLDACIEGGDSFGTCVKQRPDCDVKAVKGCCPAACLKAYQKTSQISSEAQAYREHFSADSKCGIPPKAAPEDE